MQLEETTVERVVESDADLSLSELTELEAYAQTWDSWAAAEQQAFEAAATAYGFYWSP